MTTTIITHPPQPRTQLRGDDMFPKVLAAINSHRTARPSRPRSVEPGASLGDYLLNTVRAQDAAIPAHRRAPRTATEMRARLAALYEEEQDACGLCGYWECNCPKAHAWTTGTGSTAGTAVA